MHIPWQGMGEHSGKQAELLVAIFPSWPSPKSGYLLQEPQVQLWDMESCLTTSQYIKTVSHGQVVEYKGRSCFKGVLR